MAEQNVFVEEMEGWLPTFKCPHCNKRVSLREDEGLDDNNKPIDEFNMEGRCPYCGKPFIVKQEVKLTFTTKVK